MSEEKQEYAKYIDEHTIDTNIPDRAVIDGRLVIGEFTPAQLKKLGYLPLVYDVQPVLSEPYMILIVTYELTEDAILVHYETKRIFPSDIDYKAQGDFPSEPHR